VKSRLIFMEDSNGQQKENKSHLTYLNRKTNK
jgi:hypothetical protein